MRATDAQTIALQKRILETVRSMVAKVESSSGHLASCPPTDLDEVVRALHLLDERYEERAADVAAQTKRQLADLEELHNANRLGTVGTLTVGLAHEFGTPLGVVLARAQMIVTDDPDLAEARSDANEIINQVIRMTQMCREVLDYARPKAPARIPVDVAQITKQMVTLLQLDARKRNAKLVLQQSPGPSIVLGDASKIMQVLTNLIMNAAQSMPRGGTVTIIVETMRCEPPTVEGLSDGDYVCVHVKDDGTGIRRADLPHVFESFFTTKKEGEGTGLGLAVSARIAREHDGWISVESAEGQGSTFTLRLPSLDFTPIDTVDVTTTERAAPQPDGGENSTDPVIGDGTSKTP